MNLKSCFASSLFLISGAFAAFGQTTSAHPTPLAATAPTAVPTLIPFSSVALNSFGKPLSGEVTATVLLYKDEAGGEPLWSESQTVALDSNGRYQVQLGASSPSGLPLNLFATGEGRWIEVLIPGQATQPRVLLMSVPYAMKSADAATLGGLPPSAFVLAGSTSAQTSAPSAISPDASTAVTTPGGTTGFIPAFTGSATIANSTVFQSGTKVGLSTTTPAATLDVNGTTISRGLFTLPASGTATTSTGYPSQPLAFTASAYNSSTPSVVSPTFQLKAEPTANDTSAPAASLNLLYNANAGTPAETGLSIASTGLITFAKNQTFPGTGTVTSLTAASPLTVGGTNGVLNLSLNTSALESTLNGKYIQASAANHFTGLNTFAGTSTFNGPTSFTQPVTFASGQTFGTGAGSGTITGVKAGTGLTGGGTSGSVTLNLDTTKVPTLTGNPVFTGVVTVNNSTQGSGSTTTAAIIGSATGQDGYGVLGQTAGDNAAGIYGSATSPDFGVGTFGVYSGNGTGAGVEGSFQPTMVDSAGFGVLGDGGTATGVAGTSRGNSQMSGTISTSTAVGVRADVGSPNGYAALLVTADDTFGGVVETNSTSAPSLAILNITTSTDSRLFEARSGPLNVDNGPYCEIDTNGSEYCSGGFSSENAVQNGERTVQTYAMQSAENWFEDAGTVQLVNGSAHVDLESVFGQTVNTGMEYHVFLTPDGDCKGLYVGEKNANGFDVHELGGGRSSIAFEYRIMAKRLGHENERLVDVTEQKKRRALSDAKLLHPAVKDGHSASLPKPSIMGLRHP